jgi:hypothetical protein
MRAPRMHAHLACRCRGSGLTTALRQSHTLSACSAESRSAVCLCASVCLCVCVQMCLCLRLRVCVRMRLCLCASVCAHSSMPAHTFFFLMLLPGPRRIQGGAFGEGYVRILGRRYSPGHHLRVLRAVVWCSWRWPVEQRRVFSHQRRGPGERASEFTCH